MIFGKIDYINLLLQCGFNTVEVGSFVSPRVIPQMADTGKVLEDIDLQIANQKLPYLLPQKKVVKWL